ncbi:HAMP domain-containing histidine kinase [bacterium]|nr:HAMP domain-containing histidine kinase [bacterium]
MEQLKEVALVGSPDLRGDLNRLLGCRDVESLAAALGAELELRFPGRRGLIAVCPAETRDWQVWWLPGLLQEPWPASHPLVEELRENGEGRLLTLEGSEPGDELLGLALRDGRQGLLGALAVALPAERRREPIERRLIEDWLLGVGPLAALLLERRALRERLETLEQDVDQLESLKASFIDTVTHELRTPLTSILGFSSLALDQPGLEGNQPLPEFLRSIHDSALQLDRLISELLVMSEMAAAEGVLELEDRSLASLLGEYREGWLGHLAGHERVRFHDCELKCTVRVDPYQFHRILGHLLKNALTFSPPASPVDLRCSYLSGRRRSDSMDFLRIDISDRGPGIPASEQERIFRKFYQVDRSSTREHGGAGLGLSVAKEFAEAMGGRLWLRSEPGRGSTFSFTVPVPRDAGGAPRRGLRGSRQQ